MNFEPRPLPGRRRPRVVNWPVLRLHARVYGSAILAGARPDARPISDLDRQLCNSEMVARTQPVGIEPIEKLLDVIECTDGGEVIGSDRWGPTGEVDRLWCVSRKTAILPN